MEEGSPSDKDSQLLNTRVQPPNQYESPETRVSATPASSPTASGQSTEMEHQFRSELQQSGNIQSKESAESAVGVEVRKKIFPGCKFANDEDLFAYQPVRDEIYPTKGAMFRTIKMACTQVGSDDEENWWTDMKKIVKEVLAGKRTNVTQSIKTVMTGKMMTRAATNCVCRATV